MRRWVALNLSGYFVKKERGIGGKKRGRGYYWLLGVQNDKKRETDENVVIVGVVFGQSGLG